MQSSARIWHHGFFLQETVSLIGKTKDTNTELPDKRPVQNILTQNIYTQSFLEVLNSSQGNKDVRKASNQKIETSTVKGDQNGQKATWKKQKRHKLSVT